MVGNHIPDDFPREFIRASLAGSQPKIAARLIDGRYVAGLTDEELAERYDSCEDLAQQLAAYCTRKASENSEWTQEFNFGRMRKGVEKKVHAGVWDISPTEHAWVMGRVRAILRLG